MTLLLDTSVLVALERGETEKLRELSLEHPAPPFISLMAHVEFLVGIEKFSAAKKAKLKKFLRQFPVLHTSNETALLLSKLKYDYDRKGKKKSLTDLFIASQAIEHGLTLVTKDKDFEDIAELRKVLL